MIASKIRSILKITKKQGKKEQDVWASWSALVCDETSGVRGDSERDMRFVFWAFCIFLILHDKL